MGEAILHATYLLNRWPSLVFNWKTPYELFKRHVDLRIFGCLCYSIITVPKKDKFTPRAVKCIFLGYSPGKKKGYKLYDYNVDKFIVSKDVVFYEQVYPFRSENQKENGEITEIVPLPMVLFQYHRMVEVKLFLK